jgi:hypothetical protein
MDTCSAFCRSNGCDSRISTRGRRNFSSRKPIGQSKRVISLAFSPRFKYAELATADFSSAGAPGHNHLSKPAGSRPGAFSGSSHVEARPTDTWQRYFYQSFYATLRVGLNSTPFSLCALAVHAFSQPVVLVRVEYLRPCARRSPSTSLAMRLTTSSSCAHTVRHARTLPAAAAVFVCKPLKTTEHRVP